MCYTQAYRTVPHYSLQPQPHVRKMAAKCHCDVCLKEFDYKYRYERHVETTSHKDKVRLMEIVRPQLRICKLSLNLEMLIREDPLL